MVIPLLSAGKRRRKRKRRRIYCDREVGVGIELDVCVGEGIIISFSNITIIRD